MCVCDRERERETDCVYVLLAICQISRIHAMVWFPDVPQAPLTHITLLTSSQNLPSVFWPKVPNSSQKENQPLPSPAPPHSKCSKPVFKPKIPQASQSKCGDTQLTISPPRPAPSSPLLCWRSIMDAILAHILDLKPQSNERRKLFTSKFGSMELEILKLLICTNLS